MVVADLASDQNPSFQPFVKTQINSVCELGHEVKIFNIKGPDHWYHYLTKMPMLYREVQDFNPDIVHSHYSYCAFTALVTLPYPHVVSFMGDDVLGDFNEKGTKTIRSYLHKPFATIPAFFADQIIVKSKEMAEYVKHHSVNVIANGVDFSIFFPISKLESRKKLGLNEKKTYIIFPGDIKDDGKRFSLAEASCSLLEKKYNIPHELLHMRNLSQEKLKLYFNAVDAMVFTSWSEGSPNVVKEAMACNLPIVSVYVGDVEEVISDAKNCFVVDDDPAVIASCLNIILQDPQRSNGRETITHLELGYVAKRLENIYYQVSRY